MLKNYIKIAWRNLGKSPVYSTINIMGLATAITCCLLIFLFIQYETSFNAFHQKAENIHLIVQEQVSEGARRKAIGLTPLPYGQALKDELPAIENYARITQRAGIVERGENKFSERLTFADRSLFEVFDFAKDRGAENSLLTKPGQVVLTSLASEKYFGEQDPIGETITIGFGGNTEEFIVSGVVNVPPANSSISFDVLLPLVSLPGYTTHKSNFTTNLVHTYVEIAPQSSKADLSTNLEGFVNRVWPENEEGAAPVADLMPLKELHFEEGVLFAPGTPGNPTLLYVMGGIALMVLLIACVNFVLLAIGRSAERGKEVGIRKVMGAGRKQLMAQFWGETLIQITLAVLAGMILTEVALPVFNSLANVEISWDLIGSTSITGFVILLILVVGIISGFYPAVVQSGFAPIKTLKSQAKTTGISGLGRFLIVFQYSLSISLIIGMVAIYTQLDYLKNKPLGYDGDQVVMIPTQQGEAGSYLNIIRDQVQSQLGIVSISGTSNSFTQGGAWGTKEITLQNKTVSTRDYKVDNSYLETLGIALIAGRNFSESFSSDPSNAVIVNRAFVDEMGLEEPVGTAIAFRGQREIIGVVENFHFQSLHEKVTPLVLHTSEGWPLMHIAVRLRPDQIQESIELLEAKWKELMPTQPFVFHFLDEQMGQLYKQEERWAEIITWVALLAVVIACMGLFGLTSITTENRKKEIGIRKVLGATATEVLVLVSRIFLQLFGVGFLIAVPVSYMLLNSWLANYAFHIELRWWIFVLSGLAVLFIAMATISLNSIKAALMNPVESLRSE